MGIVTERGKLYIKGEVKSGTSQSGAVWANQQIVVEVYGFNNSIKRVALQTNKTDLLYMIEELELGAEVEIKYSVSAREWQGKWYNNVELVSMTTIGNATAAPQPQTAPNPVASSRSARPKAADITPTAEDLDPNAHEDLPF